ncbi:hypothetical protein PFICI_13188 [Pestalotiopsis fici W106-1]|uniref:Siderophore biosynthesis enzyme n=1 Tax=Pestalotiopsis fici (strain W106-1 / CGMCC3.15140) TaxID=1229662 RepID=W3WLQ6_PESFW|nr:uncharacterized protein PFICI_13188 [Pestalotiopsis fici W106-1]ETS74704.1 hypothetical protein PFICI_13188 [Pestalotiopsis fici W106-1]
MFVRTTVAVAAALFIAPIAAKTDLSGCVSSETVAYGGASLVWYVPDTGEICEFLDCGGGRAPPKTTVPGCDAYAGTEAYTPSYLAGYGSYAFPTSAAAAAGSTEESVSTTSLTSDATSDVTTEATTTATTDVSGLPTITGDTTALSGTVGTITSAASLATTTTTRGSSVSTASSSSSSSSTTGSSSSVSQGAGSMATAGPMALLIACVGAAIL